MKTFSQRMGLVTAKALQSDAMDDDLRTLIWNYLSTVALDGSHPIETTRFQAYLRHQIWCFHFKKPVDEKPAITGEFMKRMKKFVLTEDWSKVYDLLEYTIDNAKGHQSKYIEIFNVIFEKENSAYRFIDGQLTLISNENAVAAIESAIANATAETAEHIRRALALMSDRDSPDYRNSVKEAISAVESACKYYSNKPGGDLGTCLKLIKRHHTISPHFERALIQLYAYTNQGEGIRHALTEEGGEVTRAEARYMITVCVAFCDYVWEIASKKP